MYSVRCCSVNCDITCRIWRTAHSRKRCSSHGQICRYNLTFSLTNKQLGKWQKDRRGSPADRLMGDRGQDRKVVGAIQFELPAVHHRVILPLLFWAGGGGEREREREREKERKL
jgi:hypothetical protein